MTKTPDDNRGLRLLLAAVCVLMGIAQLVGHYCYMSPDGLSYLDVSDRFLSGDFRNALSSYWSPVYPALIALTRSIMRPTPYWEFTTVHGANLGVFLVALISFDHLLVAVYRTLSRVEACDLLSPTPWYLFGYAVFAWTTISLTQVTRPTPDMLVAEVVFLAAIITLKYYAGVYNTGRAIALGLLLGFGYWIKAAAFPIGILWIVSCGLIPRPSVRTVKSSLVSGIAFLLVAAPLVIALSLKMHRITIGDSARLNYAWVLNGVTPFVHWQGAPPGSGIPVHPTHQLAVGLPMFAFDAPFRATYAPWFAPPYFYEGLRVHFRLREIVTAELSSARHLWSILSYPGSLIVGVWLLVLFNWSRRLSSKRLAAVAPCIVACLAMVALYTVVAIRPRYVAPFFAVTLIASVGAVRIHGGRVISRVVIVCALAVYVDLAIPVFRGDLKVYRALSEHREPHVNWVIARELLKIGVAPGSSVGSIGYAGFPFWARVARDTVTVEVYDPNRLTLNSAGYQDHVLVSVPQWPAVLSGFKFHRVQVVVARETALAPGVRRHFGWHHINGTSASYLFIGVNPTIVSPAAK